jgi:hypothetical protein
MAFLDWITTFIDNIRSMFEKKESNGISIHGDSNIVIIASDAKSAETAAAVIKQFLPPPMRSIIYEEHKK